MIPKTIHYCWFGDTPLPREAQRCIESWKRYLPDHDIREWNESSFDIRIIPFTAEAYSKRKFAYVSDYARMWIIYNHGGIYFDTDVELIRPIGDILERGAFMGFEKHVSDPHNSMYVNPGLGFGARRHNRIIREVMRCYEKSHYIMGDGSINQVPIVPITTGVLRGHGLEASESPVKVNEFTIYPYDYFCPQEYLSGRTEITDNTRSIHHYTESWLSATDKLLMRKGAFFSKGVGKWIKKMIRG